MVGQIYPTELQLNKDNTCLFFIDLSYNKLFKISKYEEFFFLVKTKQKRPDVGSDLKHWGLSRLCL